ncbi:MAG: ABC transporter ATP-binding protein [Candidatus Algichlamydia australiensis]|nr:ABC transporter ATP-binding protein [Chlamydiales bacterium]
MEDLYLIKNLYFSYIAGKQKIPALHDLTLSIPKGSFITFTGPSGSGKSTLLNILGLIEPVQEGGVDFLGDEISSMSEKKKNELRLYHLGFIFQHFHLIPVLTVEENVMYFLSSQGISRDEIERRVTESLQAVGIEDQRKKRPSELSGGQKQRVAIARAIAKKPDVIIADEPTASLDQKTGEGIVELMQELVHERGCSIIVSTHDPMVEKHSEMNFHLVDGRIA